MSVQITVRTPSEARCAHRRRVAESLQRALKKGIVLRRGGAQDHAGHPDVKILLRRFEIADTAAELKKEPGFLGDAPDHRQVVGFPAARALQVHQMQMVGAV